MKSETVKPVTFCGQPVSADDLSLIQQVVARYPRLSRSELACTVCELLEWERPNGKLKSIECVQFLDRLHDQNIVRLPELQVSKPRGTRTRVHKTEKGEAGEPLEGPLSQYKPLTLKLVSNAEERAFWRELVERYHYLGHRVAFGAHLRYLVWTENPRPAVLGCLQFSSPAWRMQSRDRWIGWDEEAHKSHLQRIVSNSRFLILPWVRVEHLASHTLSLAAKLLPKHWEEHYAIVPWLLETLVDSERYSGTCYRAANWIKVGETSGRGRQDQHTRRDDLRPKAVFLYPLRRDARKQLCRAS